MYTWLNIWDPSLGYRDPVRRFKPGNDTSKIYRKDHSAAGEWTRPGQEQGGHLGLPVINSEKRRGVRIKL